MGPNPNRPVKSKLQSSYLDTQVFSGSVQWVRPLEISEIKGYTPLKTSINSSPLKIKKVGSDEISLS